MSRSQRLPGGVHREWEMTMPDHIQTMLAHIQSVFGGPLHDTTVINTVTRPLMPENRWAHAADFCFLIGQHRAKRCNVFEITPAQI